MRQQGGKEAQQKPLKIRYFLFRRRNFLLNAATQLLPCNCLFSGRPMFLLLSFSELKKFTEIGPKLCVFPHLSKGKINSMFCKRETNKLLRGYFRRLSSVGSVQAAIAPRVLA